MFLRHGILCSDPICSLIGLLKTLVSLRCTTINVSNKYFCVLILIKASVKIFLACVAGVRKRRGATQAKISLFFSLQVPNYLNDVGNFLKLVNEKAAK